jgi:flagellar basal-body rod protein FlgB
MSDLLDKAIFNKTSIPLLGKMADLSSLRQKLISSNVANVNTPGYQSRQIDFDGELKKAMGKPKPSLHVSHPRHIPVGGGPDRSPKVTLVKQRDNSNGVNSVDIEQEMANLAQNQLVFDFGATMLAKKFKGLKAAIRGKA